jgi:hypothetical protein
MIETNNPFFWWAPVAGCLMARTSTYLDGMADLHEGTILSPVFRAGARVEDFKISLLDELAKAVEIQRPVPEYTKEDNGVVCRPAAWA